MIQLKSFIGWLSINKTSWQEWSFYNSKNIDFRSETSEIKLSKKSSFVHQVASTDWVPTCMRFWYNWWTISTDIVVFTNSGKVFGGWTVRSTLSEWIYNTIDANGVKYCIGNTKLFTFTSASSIAQTLDAGGSAVSFSTNTQTRPVINFHWDLIIGNGNSVARFNEDWTFQEYGTTSTNPVIWWLDGTVRAITQIAQNIYVWCNNGKDTNLYIWDGVSTNPYQNITYSDMPVQNVALVWNNHYWWSKKGDYGIRKVLIWESYKPQDMATSEYPKYPIETSYDDPKNRLALQNNSFWWINDIEVIDWIVYMPWIWSLYWFGKYTEAHKFAVAREHTFTGTTVTCMLSGDVTASWKQTGWFIVFAVKNWTYYDINLINKWEENAIPASSYSSSWIIESMEYKAPAIYKEDQVIKVLIPFKLTNSACSIKVYLSVNGGSYEEIKTITNTDYGTDDNVCEITSFNKKYRRIQMKLELITSDASYSPIVYVEPTIITTATWQLK